MNTALSNDSIDLVLANAVRRLGAKDAMRLMRATLFDDGLDEKAPLGDQLAQLLAKNADAALVARDLRRSKHFEVAAS